MLKRLVIIGSGDLGRLIAHHAQEDGHYQVVGFLDDFAANGTEQAGVPIMGRTEEALALYEQGRFDAMMIGVGYNAMSFRRQIYEKLAGKIPFGRIIHSSCYVDASAEVKEGSCLLPGCTLDQNVVIQENVLLNTGVVVAHDSTIDRHCFIAPAVAIAGKVQIKEGCVLGIHTTVIDNVVVGPGVRTGGGTVVIDSLLQDGLYVGVPARRIKPW